MEEKINATVEGFNLSGEEVNQLKDKHFTICAEPFYKEYPSLDKDKPADRKLVIPIKLAVSMKEDPTNSTPDVEWLANKTSQKVIIAKQGRMLDKWVGYKGEFVVKNQVVGKEERQVIYLK